MIISAMKWILIRLLSSTSKRAHLIDGLIQAAAACGMDGINIDFEQLSEETGEHFVQFIRELSIPCRANGIVLSVDNYVPVGNTGYYGRAEQGRVADYVIIMGYDEHWSGSKEAGSVASIGFVEKGIQKTLEEVLSRENYQCGTVFTQEWKSGGGDVTSDAVGMDSADQFLAEQGYHRYGMPAPARIMRNLKKKTVCFIRYGWKMSSPLRQN